MVEQPSIIAREAKGIHQSLKELLKTREPFDKEVDFQRKNLRKRYLSLLLSYPRAKESKDVENHLWMQTSYAFIASYKQRVLNLDRIIQSNVKQPPPLGEERALQNQKSPNGGRAVEHRKLMQRFRQFLAEEEKFWNQLAVRLRRSFGLEEATGALVALGIVNQTDEALSHQLPPDTGIEGSGAPAQPGRGQIQFPAEDPSTTFIASSGEEKEAWLAVMAKTLICLGDINRYRELYNGKPRAGDEGGPIRRGRGGRRGGSVDFLSRPRNYDKAHHCYEQARLLVPTDGNPSHQLAILATYQKDSFMSLVHYYRALCVRSPFDTASENLNSVLLKALEHWRSRSRREKERADSMPPKVQTDLFKDKTVVLHALWKIGTERGPKKMESLSRRHHKGVYDDFRACISERHLPTDMISNAVVLSQGALWKHRMVRTTPIRTTDTPSPPEGTPIIVEWHILQHILDLHRALLEVGIEQLKVPLPKDTPGDDLAQNITAIFRRTLPALRIASKWLRANVKYLIQDHEFNSYQAMKRIDSIEIPRNGEYQYSKTSGSTRRFWRTYAEFMTSLWTKFPISRLPPFTAPLEEDTEMKGFLPLKNLMGVSTRTGEGEQATTGPRHAQEVHPNDWQLMRIADLLNDGKELTAVSDFPVSMSFGAFQFTEEIVEPDSVSRINSLSKDNPPHQQISNQLDTHVDLQRAEQREDDGMTEGTSRTDDDILREAFDVIHASEQELEDEEIVWDPRASVSPVITSALNSPSSHVIATPTAQSVPLLKSPIKTPPSKTIPSSFTTHNAVANQASTTAQDLLNDVLSGRTTRTHLESSAPQPALLFGSELPHRQGHNIWSVSQEEQSLKFTSQPNQTYQQRQAQNALDLGAAQPIWTSFYNGAQNSHHDIAGSLPPSSTQAGQAPSMFSGVKAHHHAPSGSLATGGPSPYPPFVSVGSIHEPPMPPVPTQQQQLPISPQYLYRSDGSAGTKYSLDPGFTSSALTSQLVQDPRMLEKAQYHYGHQPSRSHSYSHQYSLNAMHDPRMVQPPIAAPPPPMSRQIWGNVG